MCCCSAIAAMIQEIGVDTFAPRCLVEYDGRLHTVYAERPTICGEYRWVANRSRLGPHMLSLEVEGRIPSGDCAEKGHPELAWV